jgi:hypothetical protein
MLAALVAQAEQPAFLEAVESRYARAGEGR